ncbi:MAG: ASCH domain-containing protein [Candidatus Woesearchaeota archaeon]
MDCLIIKKEHLDKIFSGKKTWEIRSSRTHKRGKIGLIQSGSGNIVGECEVVDCSDELTLEEYLKNKDKHCSENTKLTYKKTYAWVLKNAKRYSKPLKYKHPAGAIIWVKV